MEEKGSVRGPVAAPWDGPTAISVMDTLSTLSLIAHTLCVPSCTLFHPRWVLTSNTLTLFYPLVAFFLSSLIILQFQLMSIATSQFGPTETLTKGKTWIKKTRSTEMFCYHHQNGFQNTKIAQITDFPAKYRNMTKSPDDPTAPDWSGRSFHFSIVTILNRTEGNWVSVACKGSHW